MLRPAIAEDLKEDQNIFALVIAVSKRAREITDEIESKKHLLIEKNSGKLPADLNAELEEYFNAKPVRLAVEEFGRKVFNFVPIAER
ncbi:MAG: DNA-directed RNA polymerase subunit omega [Oscillospiraceae bacterium]|jgi:DNA-directed RNA polymerase subunit omega|nr:DNA-directed RNA polymerase subunit omega [Oscillospiraceae bacterium]